MCVKERTGVGRYVETDVGKGTWRFRSGCVGTLFAQTGWLVDQFHFFYFSLHALHTHTHTHDTPPSHWSTHRKQKKKFKNKPRSGPLSSTPRESCTVWRYPSRPVSTAIHQYTPISFPCRTPQDNFFLKKNYYFYALPSFFTAPTFAPLLLVYPSKSTSPFLQQLISIYPFPSTPPSVSQSTAQQQRSHREQRLAHTQQTTCPPLSIPTHPRHADTPRWSLDLPRPLAAVSAATSVVFHAVETTSYSSTTLSNQTCPLATARTP